MTKKNYKPSRSMQLPPHTWDPWEGYFQNSEDCLPAGRGKLSIGGGKAYWLTPKNKLGGQPYESLNRLNY